MNCNSQAELLFHKLCRSSSLNNGKPIRSIADMYIYIHQPLNLYLGTSVNILNGLICRFVLFYNQMRFKIDLIIVEIEDVMNQATISLEMSYLLAGQNGMDYWNRMCRRSNVDKLHIYTRNSINEEMMPFYGKFCKLDIHPSNFHHMHELLRVSEQFFHIWDTIFDMNGITSFFFIYDVVSHWRYYASRSVKRIMNQVRTRIDGLRCIQFCFSQVDSDNLPYYLYAKRHPLIAYMNLRLFPELGLYDPVAFEAWNGFHWYELDDLFEPVLEMKKRNCCHWNIYSRAIHICLMLCDKNLLHYFRNQPNTIGLSMFKELHNNPALNKLKLYEEEELEEMSV